MDLRRNALGIVLLVCIFVSLSRQESTRATLFITLREYNNTNSELFDGNCCDGLAVSNKCSSDRCDYVIKICVSPDENGKWCQSTELNADQPPDLVFLDQTPRELPIAEWKGSARVDISITDIDGPSTQQLVDRFSFNYTEKGSKIPKPRELLLKGKRPKPSRLRLSMAIQCQTYYYGDECSVFCIPSVDCKGHYRCDENTGAKICDQGWEGKDCTRPIGDGSCPGQHCENGGTCSMDKFSNTTNDVFFCCCPPGYTGNRCEIDLDECRQNPCQYGGTCRNTPGSYICNCHPRYRGMNCEIPTTCRDNPCVHGKCSDATNGTFTCHCGSEFSGMFCENVITTTTRSTSTTSTTTESTTTTSTTTTPRTTTTPSTTTTTIPTTTKATPTTTHTTETFTSTTTSVTAKTLLTTKPSSTIDTTKHMTSNIVTPSSGKVSYNCSENACRNNGKCINSACQCLLGFSGQLCQKEVIECQNDTCLNGGYCNDVVGNYSCDCLHGFAGSRCEKHAGSSTVSPTVNACGFCGNGSCLVLGNGTAFCVCKQGFSGKTCAHSNNLCRPYSDALCFSGSQCMLKSFRTNTDICPHGWAGPICRNGSIALSRDLECPRVVCKNDGHCFNGKCCCRPGYKGEFCEEEILHCDSSPCKNNATCINIYNDFECHCQMGFTGRSCEVSLFYPLFPTTSQSSEVTTQPNKPTISQQITSTSSIDSSSKETLSINPTTYVSHNVPTESSTSKTTTLTETTEKQTTGLIHKQTSFPVSKNVPVTTEASSSSVTQTITQKSTQVSSTDSATLSSRTTKHNLSTIKTQRSTTTDSVFARCYGDQCFLNGTCLNTSFGRTECNCMKVDMAKLLIVDCKVVDTSLTTVTYSIASSSSFQTTTPSGGSHTTSQVTSSYTSSTPILSTTNSKSSLKISPSTVMTVTKVRSTPSQNRGNMSVTLSGKIPDNEIPAIKQVITNAVKNTSKGENCTDINILDKEYLYSISRDVYTKVIYNSSDCPNAADLHKNPNLTDSINNQLANSGQLSNYGVFSGKTTGLGRSYHVPLIGYVYNIYRSGIKTAIKQAWSNAGNKLVDVLIVDAAYKIGDYGIYVTDISYLVTSGLTFLQAKPENIPKDQAFYKEFQTEFPDMQVMMYTGNESYGYESGLRLSLQQRKRTTSLTAADIYKKTLAVYKNALKDNGLCLQQACNVGLKLSPLEDTPTKERSVDVMLYPTLDGHLNTEPTVLKALITKLSTHYQICNVCKNPRLHYVDIAGRVKLKDENNIRNAINTVFETIDTSWRKQSFLSRQNSIATRLYYLPSQPNDTRTEWPRPNMEGKLDLINNSLSSLNRRLAVDRMKRLHQLVLKEAVPESEQKRTSLSLSTAWATANKHVSQRALTTDIQSWNNFYVSSKGETVTQIKYTVNVMNADSSLAAVSSPSVSVMGNVLKSVCDCRAYRVRMLWTKDTQGFNSTVIQKAVSNAWILANNGLGLTIPVKVLNTESGYVAGSGDNVRMYTYFIQPRKGLMEVEEDDLDEPSSVQLEQELSNLVPGSRVFSTASKKSEPEGTEWWVYVVIAVGCLALVIILATLIISAVRARNHRQSRTLKQDPKQMNGYDKEHFSKEPVMEKNSNGLYAVEDEDTDYSKTTYIVNDAFTDSYRE
ncbi:uncharacterized protein LOC134232878 [Saccostrea cucullata]|uniref:uncharacterized protein LOC134232878 n=1 Tax=Saccostrea cuccullata TaxID=36930 RepID=UPI002ECFC013